jgi:hypothetical protein
MSQIRKPVKIPLNNRLGDGKAIFSEDEHDEKGKNWSLAILRFKSDRKDSLFLKEQNRLLTSLYSLNH